MKMIQTQVSVRENDEVSQDGVRMKMSQDSNQKPSNAFQDIYVSKQISSTNYFIFTFCQLISLEEPNFFKWDQDHV